ncbi:hypothetical protein [Rhizobium leguminosarum]|uniref:hypothetical protein n=1 Tax=Rhizobium leguminosarum TaxID=384 RepID=UPI00103C6CA5|nr:hypothetical protein [Rhizobium leguminosarum]MBY5788401.1 hypothetical protein [Rhizobium leguminosarum]NKL97304.1 hypothetical protein [Rhizobium leguminosarum bv. viciae]TBZ21303.1 hypothetical protein E0H33_02045 [Rhizobium leguminosarum bv. viciae]
MPIASTMAAATVVFVSDCRISLFLDARELGERIAELNEGRCRKARPSSETGIDCYQRLSTTEAAWRIRLSTVRGMMLMQEPAAVQANIA